MCDMDGRAIGVFDSGLGGLTTVKTLKQLLPTENILYFGDTGRVPYGSRSNETIRRYARQAMDFLREQDVKLMIAACGTVSSLVMEPPGDLPLPYTGVVKPASAAAVKATQTGRVGVIGTTATINSRSYEKELQRLRSGVEVFSKACPLFVPLVESGFFASDDEVARLVCRRYLGEMKEQNVDTLILGCTHFPLLAPVISEWMGEGVQLIDAGRQAAEYAKELLEGEDLLNMTKKMGDCSYYVSDDVQNFSELAEIFLGETITRQVQKIQLGS